MSRQKMFAATLIALSLAGSSCSSNGKAPAAGGKTRADGIVLLAAAKTQEAGSSKIAMTADINSAGQAITMTGEGAFDYKRQVGEMVLKLKGAQIPAAFSGYEMRIVQQTIYMKFPASFAQFAPGLKQWVRISASDVAARGGAGFPGVGTFGNQDPTSAIAFMNGAHDVRSEGTAKVRGVETTHYTMTINLKDVLAKLSEAQRKSYGDSLTKMGVTELPMQAWVDAQGRARRISFTMDLSKTAKGSAVPASAPKSGAMTITMDLYDFGTPVTVTAPPAGQVSDFSELSKLRK